MVSIITTPLCSLNDSTDGNNSPASSSGTPAEGEYLVAFCGAYGTVLNAPSLVSSANGINWSLVAAVQANTNIHRLYAYVADRLVPASPSAMTVQMTGYASDPGTGWLIDVQRVQGYAAVPTAKVGTTPNKAGAIPATVNLPSAATSGHAVLAAQMVVNNPPGLTAPAGWTEFMDLGISTPTGGMHAMGRTNFTGTTITWSGNTGAGAVVALELVPAEDDEFVGMML